MVVFLQTEPFSKRKDRGSAIQRSVRKETILPGNVTDSRHSWNRGNRQAHSARCRETGNPAACLSTLIGAAGTNNQQSTGVEPTACQEPRASGIGGSDAKKR